MKRIHAFLTSAALLLSFSSGMLPQEITAAAMPTVRTQAEETAGTITLDETSGTLTLSGSVVLKDVKAYAQNEAVKKVIAAKGTVLPESCYGMFSKFTAETIDLSQADTSHVNDMSLMFSGCTALTDLNISGIDTSHVTNMQGLFSGESAMTELDLSGLDTSAVTKMNSMFSGMQSMTALDVSGLDTSNVTDMSSMFGSMKQLETLDLSGFDTSNVRAMSSMFYGDNALTSLNVSGFDTANVTKMDYMFYQCKALTTLDLSCFETANVTEMQNMFKECTSLQFLNLAKFSTPRVTKIEEIFSGDSRLTTILATGSWSMESISGTGAFNMFKGCTALVGGNHTLFMDSGPSDYNFANVDTFEKAGYFTDAAGSLTPPPITDVAFDEATGTLTLSGKVNFSHVAQSKRSLPQQARFFRRTAGKCSGRCRQRRLICPMRILRMLRACVRCSRTAKTWFRSIFPALIHPKSRIWALPFIIAKSFRHWMFPCSTQKMLWRLTACSDAANR